MQDNPPSVLVTGGSRGIGKALVSYYLAQGYQVFATTSSADSAAKAKTEQPEVEWFYGNFANPQAVDKLGQQLSRYQFDIVIHNVGVQIVRQLFAEADTTPSPEAELNTNLGAAIQLTTHLLPVTRQHMCFISSGLAIAPKQSAPVYCAAKAGLRTFTRCLRKQAESHPDAPFISEAIMDLVATDMTRDRIQQKKMMLTPNSAAEQVARGIKKRQPEIRVGKVKALMKLRTLFPNLIENMLIAK